MPTEAQKAGLQLDGLQLVILEIRSADHCEGGLTALGEEANDHAKLQNRVLRPPSVVGTLTLARSSAGPGSQNVSDLTLSHDLFGVDGVVWTVVISRLTARTPVGPERPRVSQLDLKS